MPDSSSKDKRWLPAIIAASVLVGVAMWASTLLPDDNAPATDVKNTPTTAPVAAFTPQTLGIWQGKLARFEGDDSIPTEVYDVVIATLPFEAQQQLAQGITVVSEAELAALLENYTS